MKSFTSTQTCFHYNQGKLAPTGFPTFWFLESTDTCTCSGGWRNSKWTSHASRSQCPCFTWSSFILFVSTKSIKCKSTVLLERQALAPGLLSSPAAIKIQDTHCENPYHEEVRNKYCPSNLNTLKLLNYKFKSVAPNLYHDLSYNTWKDVFPDVLNYSN